MNSAHFLFLKIAIWALLNAIGLMMLAGSRL